MSETEVEKIEGVRAVDREGREVIVPREAWSSEVLPAMIRQAWDQPEQLYLVIANSLAEGFVIEVTEAAAHLYASDPLPARGAAAWGAVLIRLERLVEAELVLTQYLDRYGDNGPVLSTLAQVYAAKGEAARAEETAARAQALREQQVQIGMVRVDGPVWLPAGSPARAVFGAKAAGAAAVTFLGGSAEAAGGELSDALAGMTRALPLFLAEQTELRTAAAGRALLPWSPGVPGREGGGFLVSSQAWPEETAVQLVGTAENRSEYVVTVHVDAEVEPWEATLTFLRASDGVRIGELSAEFMPEDAQKGLLDLADEVVELLEALGPGETAAAYVVPERFGEYLRGLESLLAIRCLQMPGAPGAAGAGAVLEAGFRLCEAEAENVPARVLLLETMGAVAQVAPKAAREYGERFAALVKDRPLAVFDAVLG